MKEFTLILLKTADSIYNLISYVAGMGLALMLS